MTATDDTTRSPERLAPFEVVFHLNGASPDGRLIHLDKRFDDFAPTAALADVRNVLNALVRDLAPFITVTEAWIEMGAKLP